MKTYIQTLGKVIEKQTATSPTHARDLLTAAYSWVRFTGKHSHKKELSSAYKYMNGAVAGTIVDSFRSPKESVMVNIFFPCELLHAMKIQPMFPEGISAYTACTACQRIFAEAAEENDVPETFCSYHKTMLGLAETGVMPAPLMITNTTLACDANQLSFRRLAEFYQVPHAVIDIPRDNSEDAVHYVADQLRALTPQLEESCHRKLDAQVLRDTIACSKRTLENFQDYLKQRGQVSLTSTMTGEMCSMIAMHVMLGRPESEQYMLRLLQTAQAAKSGKTGKSEKSGKARIFWMHTMPNWQDSMKDILETGGRCELVGCDTSVDFLGEINPDQPYESMARRAVESLCNGPAVRRIEGSVRAAKLLKADGVIIFCHWGCKQTLGLSQMAKQMMEAEGFPTLVLDGDGCDARNVADGQMVTRVNAFLEQLEGLRT